MGLSLKTKNGREKKKYHTKGHIREGRWNAKGTQFSEWLEPANEKNSKEMRELSAEWAKTPKPKYMVEHYDIIKQENVSIDADLFAIRKCREIKEILANASKV